MSDNEKSNNIEEYLVGNHTDGEHTITTADLPELMNELRAMASNLLRQQWNTTPSIMASDLVQSAFRRQGFKGQMLSELTWPNRHHFFGAMYQAMNRSLLDHARKRNAEKRQSNDYVPSMRQLDQETPENLAALDQILTERRQLQVIQLGDLQVEDLLRSTDEAPEQTVAFIDTLIMLEEQKPELAEIVQHRIYSNLSLEQTAKMMGMSVSTVQRRWTEVRAWMHHEVRKKLDNTATD